jgi:F-type H+-transporting ATPase subunit delta
MAISEAIHRAWAEALFDLALAAHQVEQVEAELAAIAQLLEQEPLLRVFVTTPKIRVEQKQALLERVFNDRVRPLLARALQVMALKRRLDALPGISRVFATLVDRNLGRQRVAVRTVVELTTETRSQLQSALEQRLGKSVILEEQVDPEIIGGLVFTYGDVRVDGSIRRRLARFLNDVKNKVRAPARH